MMGVYVNFGELTLEDINEIQKEIEKVIEQMKGSERVIIHIEPDNGRYFFTYRYQNI
jgi:divalent metal cation (Fe/Co/Zn/Cd) transporter